MEETWAATPPRVRALLLSLLAAVQQLEPRVAELEARRNQTSRNSSKPRVAHQLLALAGMIGAMAGFLGLLWGQCFHGRLGPAGVIIYVVGYGLIVVGGLALLIAGPGESPLFLVFPIGGLLQDVGYLLFGIASLRSARWRSGSPCSQASPLTVPGWSPSCSLAARGWVSASRSSPPTSLRLP